MEFFTDAVSGFKTHTLWCNFAYLPNQNSWKRWCKREFLTLFSHRIQTFEALYTRDSVSKMTSFQITHVLLFSMYLFSVTTNTGFHRFSINYTLKRFRECNSPKRYRLVQNSALSLLPFYFGKSVVTYMRHLHAYHSKINIQTFSIQNRYS